MTYHQNILLVQTWEKNPSQNRFVKRQELVLLRPLSHCLLRTLLSNYFVKSAEVYICLFATGDIDESLGVESFHCVFMNQFELNHDDIVFDVIQI